MPTRERTTYRGFFITTRWFEVLNAPNLLQLRGLGCANARQFSGSFSVAPISESESPWQEFPPRVFDTGINASAHALEQAKRSIDFRFTSH